MRKHGNLKKAWQTIKSNGRKSSSPYVKDDIDRFTLTEETNIRSISSKIQHGTFKFSPARGVALKKQNKPGSIRPIVIPRAQDRVVHRCILDALVSDPRVRATAFRPTSFGGIPKFEKNDLAEVPAAINAVLQSISDGGTHVIVADIAHFFGNIRKSDALRALSNFCHDDKFFKLLTDAVRIDLDNHEALWRYKADFPYNDIGVGQGVCLSPFLGNILLSSFYDEMNEGDCTCIRYVDDIIIIAPSGKAASARLRRAERILNEFGMSFSSEKTDRAPKLVKDGFDYLGIQFTNGLIRPSQKSRRSILERIKSVASLSLMSLKTAKDVREFDLDQSIPKTLQKISGMSKGWANHYRFCNDIESIKNVDNQIMKVFLSYSKKENELAHICISNNKSDLAAAFLGYSGMKGIVFQPFEFPDIEK